LGVPSPSGGGGGGGGGGGMSDAAAADIKSFVEIKLADIDEVQSAQRTLI